jgi:hypothetical protein
MNYSDELIHNLVALWERNPHHTNKQLSDSLLDGIKPKDIGPVLKAAGISPELRRVAKKRARLWQQAKACSSLLTSVIVAAKLRRLGYGEVAIAGHFGLSWPQWMRFRNQWIKEIGYHA